MAEELNFSRAAERMHITQPPLTRHIQALESKLKCRLLTRNTRTVALTETGSLFLEDARRVLNQIDASVDAVERAEAGEHRRLRVGFVGALLDDELITLLQRLRTEMPACQVDLSDLHPAGQMDALIKGTVDAAFVGVAPTDVPRTIHRAVWKTEPLKIALPASHFLAGSTSLRLADLKEESWILVSKAAAPGFRAFVDELWSSARFAGRVLGESERIAAVLTMVAAGQGISIVPASVEKLIRSGIKFLPIAGRRVPLLEHAVLINRHPNRPEIEWLTAVLPATRPNKRKRNID